MAIKQPWNIDNLKNQVSESPIVLQAFLFLHILTIIYLCLSIVLKRVHLDPHP